MRIELRGFEDRFIGLEINGGAMAAEAAHFFQAAGGLTAPECLPPFEAIAADGGDQFLRQRVYDGRANAVQAAGMEVIAPFAELGSRVERRQDELQRGPFKLRMQIDRDAS